MNYLLLAGVAAVAATGAQAQSGPFTYEGGTIELGLHFNDNYAGDPYSENYVTSLTARADLSFGPMFGMGVSLAYINEENAGAFFSDRYFVGIHPYYRFDNGRVGVFYQYEDEISDSGTANHMYGIEGDFTSGPFTAEGYFGREDSDGGDDETVYGAALRYDLTPAFAGYVLHRGDIEEGGSDGDEFTNALGIRYDMGQSPSGPPIMLYAEIGQLRDASGGGDTSNYFGIRATFSWGGAEPSTLGQWRRQDYYYD